MTFIDPSRTAKAPQTFSLSELEKYRPSRSPRWRRALAALNPLHLARADKSRERLLSKFSREVLFIHADGRVLEMSDSAEQMFGEPARALIGTAVLDLFADYDAAALIRRENGRPEDLMSEEFEIKSASGALAPVELTSQRIQHEGRPATVVSLRSIADRNRDEAKLRYWALHDVLTDLPNRHFLLQRLDKEIEHARLTKESFAVVFVDLDRFRRINDAFGHTVGDLVLKGVAARWRALLKPEHMLARMAGDRFVAIIRNVADAEAVLEQTLQMIEAMRDPFVYEGRAIELSASGGIALCPKNGESAQALMQIAEDALTRVKRTRAGGAAFFESEFDEAIADQQRLQKDLEKALVADELELFFQPIVNGETGDIETFEALLRWRHPERGYVSPSVFVPLAEKTGLIVGIGRWVIEHACAQAASWPANWRVAINVSPIQLLESDVAKVIARALARSRISPARVIIEMTESVFIRDQTAAVKILQEIRDLGVRLALDDFGAGYSSLSYLHLFKFDEMKIDQSFIRTLAGDGDTLTIVKAILALGRNLGLKITVEGVETKEQFQLLRNLGCDQMQGYIFARPAPDVVLNVAALSNIAKLFRLSK